MLDSDRIVRLIDADRRAAERAILAILRGTFAKVYTHALAAARLGHDPLQAARDVLLGNPALGLPGLPARLAPALLAADYAGYRRTVLMVPVQLQQFVGFGRASVALATDRPLALSAIPQPPQGYRSTVDYRARAVTAAGQLLTTLGRRVREGLAVARGGIQSARDAIRATWRRWGYGGQGNKETAISVAAEALGGEAFQAGYALGLSRPEVRQAISGLVFSATLDANTTQICRVRHGIKVVQGDAWLLRNFPMLHFGCRSTWLPLFGPFTPTRDLPELPPPMPGFGIAPASLGSTWIRLPNVA